MTVSTLAIVLVLGCALAFSGVDLLRKVLSVAIRPVPLLFALSAGMMPPFALWYLLEGAAAPAAGYWLPGLGSALVNVLANLLFLEALRRSPLSLTIPLLSLTPVFTALLAIPLLGEMPVPRQWLGIAVVVAGAFWLQLGPGAGSWRQAGRRFVAEPGSRMMLAVALLWSLAMPMDKLAVVSSSAAFHGLILGGVIALILWAWSAARGRVGDWRDLRYRPGLIAAAVLLGVGALVLQLLAITIVWVGFVETLKRGLGSLLALVWDRLFFDEPFAAHRLLAVLLMAAGVALIVL